MADRGNNGEGFEFSKQVILSRTKNPELVPHCYSEEGRRRISLLNS